MCAAPARQNKAPHSSGAVRQSDSAVLSARPWAPWGALWLQAGPWSVPEKAMAAPGYAWNRAALPLLPSALLLRQTDINQGLSHDKVGWLGELEVQGGAFDQQHAAAGIFHG